MYVEFMVGVLMTKLKDVFSLQITGEWGIEYTENETNTKVLRTTNFTLDGIINYSDVVLRCIHKDKVEKKKLRYGDIILEKSGGTEKTPVGRVVFCDESIEKDTYLCNNFTQAMRVNREIAVPKYVFYFMWNLHNSGKTELLQNKTTGIRNLQVKSYLNEEIPLPPLDEQRKIAAVLDKVSDLIAKRRQQLTKLDELVKARFVEMFGDCKQNPKNWSVCNLEEVAQVGSSKRVFVEELKGAGIPFFRGTEIGALGEGKKIQPELFITEEHYWELCIATGKPQIGDLLMPSICPDGRIWVVNSEEPFYFKDGRVLWVHDIKKEFNSVFLLYTLKDRIMTDYDSIASGTTFAELKIFSLKQCKIFNVPIKLQNQFAYFVKQTEETKTAICQSLDKLETLKKNLMQKYFN